MPRKNRIHLDGHIWHITQRCHQKEFLLDDPSDRRHWRRWLGEATRRHGLEVLDYVATSNHVHLLAADQGAGEIAPSMQLVSGCTAQRYNRREERRGAFWDGRYHATAVDSDTYLARCIVYIDTNMVRARVVDDPTRWEISGIHELLTPDCADPISNLDLLTRLLGIATIDELRDVRRQWLEEQIPGRDPIWTESVAVGSERYLERVKADLGIRGRYLTTRMDAGRYVLA